MDITCIHNGRHRETRNFSQYVPANVSPLGIPEWKQRQAHTLQQDIAFSTPGGKTLKIGLRGANLGVGQGETFTSTKLFNESGVLVFWSLRNRKTGYTILLADHLRREASKCHPIIHYLLVGGAASYFAATQLGEALSLGVTCTLIAATLAIVFRQKAAARALLEQWRESSGC